MSNPISEQPVPASEQVPSAQGAAVAQPEPVVTPAAEARAAEPRRFSGVLPGASGVLLLATAFPTLAVFAYTEPELPVLAEAPTPSLETSFLPTEATDTWTADPAAAPPAPDSLVGKVLAAVGGPMPAGAAAGPLPGGMGRLGPISGALNTSLPSGPIRGPIWSGAPLPRVGPGSLVVETGGAPPAPVSAVFQPGRPVAPASPNGSELPDARTLELSRLADPEAEIQAIQRRGKPDAAAEKPLRVSLALGRPANGYQPGETVTARVSANQDCYAAVIRVNNAGQAEVVFRSGGATRGFSCAVKAGDNPGNELLFVVASVKPLGGAHAGIALRSVGAGPSVVTVATGLGGPSGEWRRPEWAAASASFAVKLPVNIADSRPETTRKPESKPEVKPEVKPVASKPEPPQSGGDASTLPTAPARPEEKPQAETPKPQAEPKPVVEKPEAPAPDKPVMPPTTRGK